MGRGGPNVGKRADKIGREFAAVPKEEIGSERTTVGTAKWWDDARGYGAIATDRTAPWDIWTHFGAIEDEGFRKLVTGERVEVHYQRLDKDGFKYVASAVRRTAASPDTNL